MILSQPFPSPDAATAFFNASPALRLVSVLPPASDRPGYLALYDDTPADAPLEETRQRLLEERLLVLWGADKGAKRGMNYPESIVGKPLVPLAVANNRISQLAAFKGLTNAERAQWIRANVAAVGAVLISADEARAQYQCRCELVGDAG